MCENAAMESIQKGSAGFVLAGGKSSRMGADKAFLELGGKTLLNIALGLAAGVCERVAIVGDRARFGSEAIEDIFPDSGPLGGIHAALTTTKSDLNLVVAVDTPFLEPKFLRWMLHRAATTHSIVTVPRLASGFQPLCAVYRRSFKGFAEAALKNADFKIDPLYAKVRTCPITDAELNQLAFDSRMFDNLNTRAEFERALKAKT
jgi:molybdopterin-guanine dinucleotide biosynthesis protein A